MQNKHIVQYLKAEADFHAARKRYIKEKFEAISSLIALGYTSAAIAKKVGVSQQEVSRWYLAHAKREI